MKVNTKTIINDLSYWVDIKFVYTETPDIKYFCVPKEGLHNTVVFINKVDFDLHHLLMTCHDCLFISEFTYDVEEVITNPYHNAVVSVNDARYAFAKVLLKYRRLKLFGEPKGMKWWFNKSRTIQEEGCRIHRKALVGEIDFCPIQSPDGKETIMFPQRGFTKLGKRVEIMANSFISRGALWSTEVGDDTKIDVFCQVGHNCKVGKNCMLAAGVILSGGCTIGDNTFLGVGVLVRNGVHIGSNCSIGQGCNVTKDIPDHSVVVGNPGKIIRQTAVHFNPTDVPKR